MSLIELLALVGVGLTLLGCLAGPFGAAGRDRLLTASVVVAVLGFGLLIVAGLALSFF
jgi:hypothetical protein